ncbi:outer membrane murein-binding lipoprotein Lpp [Bradyrhizobium diazoefficiens]
MKADEPREAGGKRRLSAMAAVVAIAASVGAISGALATAGMMHFAAPVPAPAQVADTSALDASVARIDADLVALKANVEHTSKTGLNQFNRANDRLDKLEKAQAEPMARIAKLSETVDKLRATPPAAPAQAAAAPARETTGSIAPTQVATAAAAPAPVPAAPKTEVGRLPTIEGWVLRDVANGGALIEGRGGLYEVYAGDPIPGVGRVDAIRRQDGRWVVVTSKGLIVAR